MGKQLVDNGDSGLVSRTKINENATELYEEDVEIGGIKTHTSFPVTPSLAPTSDYQVANKKYVDDNAGGGEFQIYEMSEFTIDANNTGFWMKNSTPAVNSMNEWNQNTGIDINESLLDMADATITTANPAGVAQGAQTIESLDFWFGKNASSLTRVGLLKVRTSANHTVVDSKAILLQKIVTVGTDGYLSIPLIDFTTLAISDKDIILLYFFATTLLDISPNYMLLKCSKD